MQYLNIAGYQFIALTDLQRLQANLLASCQQHAIKGTILLSSEGINITLAGLATNIMAWQADFASYSQFADIKFRQSYSTFLPFKRLKVKIKQEIITFKQTHIHAQQTRAASIAPEVLKQWLDEKREIVLLDTRNTYEVQQGTFKQAQHLSLNDFSELAHTPIPATKEQVVVMFCTGGIRCEKAALFMQHQGYQQVYQLEGGILNYFARVGGDHYQGHCFVFDDRGAVDTNLRAVS